VISLGWMSNWLYAGIVPTENWRGATTVPREISLLKLNNDYYLTAKPVKELAILNDKKLVFENVKADQFNLNQQIGGFSSPGRLSFSAKTLVGFSVILSNDAGENVVIGYDEVLHQYYIDRTHSGKTDFEKSFGGKAIAPRITEKGGLDITLIFDKASIELFADKGLTVMTEIFFPNQPFNHIQLKTPAGFIVDKLEWNNLNSIWKK
jgi:fructan beta-fructosidase